VTTERIADAQNRTAALPYKQHPDSAEFHLIRAKLRSEGGDAQDTVTLFERAVSEKRYANEAAARYGLVSALLRARRAQAADGRDGEAPRHRCVEPDGGRARGARPAGEQ
jgi:predicted Zn-dependent protease